MNEYMSNMWIDAIQNAKRGWVSTWVKDETLSKPLNEFIDTQTAFTKASLKQINEFSNATGEMLAKVVK